MDALMSGNELETDLLALGRSASLEQTPLLVTHV
jgi:hypothetical protein